MTIFAIRPASGRCAAPLAWLRGRLKGAPPPPEVATLDRVSTPAAEPRASRRNRRAMRGRRWIWLRFSAGADRAASRRQSSGPSDANLALNSLCGCLRAGAGEVAGLKPLPPLARSPTAFPAPQSEASGATRTSRSNSPTPTLKARRPRLARCRQSRRPRQTAALEPSAPAAAPEPSAPAADPRLAAASAHFSGRDPLQEGRRRGPHGARRGGH